MNIADNPVFQDAEKAREFLESLLWGDAPICPHCGLIGCANQFHGKGGAKGTKHRAGVYKCKGCEKQFTVTVGTVFERSHIPLNKWLLILHLMVCSKKGISAHQIHRMLGLTYKSAWFACHRIREAMRDGRLGPLGGANKVVEIDETYVGGKEANKHGWKRTPGSQGGANKAPVLSLIERDGMVRSQHVANVNSKTLGPIITQEVHKASYIMTDDAAVYPAVTKDFAGHGTVNHSAEEYVRAQFWHTNSVENYFSILKRGITGTFHHVSEAHLHRYLAEFDFRHNARSGMGVNDAERMAKAAKGIVGKRLSYRRIGGAEETEQEIPF
ncbi:MAG TPA: IS1595 family transposase [Stellaceae bacterium]|nr:IS1595 family transposase [Stellaceae bacterium]